MNIYIDRDIVLALMSIVGAWSTISIFFQLITSYRALEKMRERSRKKKSFGLFFRIKLLFTAAGCFSAIKLYFENREFFNDASMVMFIIFVIWLYVNKKPPF